MPASKAVPFLVIMENPSLSKELKGRLSFSLVVRPVGGTGRRGSQAKGGGHKQVVVWAYHTQYTTHVWNCQADNEGQPALHTFRVVRPLWEHSSRAELHLLMRCHQQRETDSAMHYRLGTSPEGRFPGSQICAPQEWLKLLAFTMWISSQGPPSPFSNMGRLVFLVGG